LIIINIKGFNSNKVITYLFKFKCLQKTRK
jgi:hypothetical protein